MARGRNVKYFFFIADDENLLPYITDLHQQMDVRHLNKQDAHKIERFTTLSVEPNDETLYADVLIRPLFMVSKSVAEVISYYDTSIDYKIAALFDLENKIGTTYYIPILDKVDCLTEDTEFNRDRSVIRNAVIDPKKTMGKAVFKLAGVKNSYYVARLDFVESLLRRKAIGLRLEEIQLKNTD
jgi:hypothetical protein